MAVDPSSLPVTLARWLVALPGQPRRRPGAPAFEGGEVYCAAAPPVSCSFADLAYGLSCPSLAPSKHALGAWSPTASRPPFGPPGPLVTALVFDLDRPSAPPNEEPIEADFERLDRKGLLYCAHTSFSHEPPIKSAWRVVVALEPPGCPAELYSSAFKIWLRALGLKHADPARKDAARIWYLPGFPPERAKHWRFLSNAGEPLPAQPPGAEPEPRTAPRVAGGPEDFCAAPPEARAAFWARLRELWPPEAGNGRHDLRMALIGACVEAGFSDNEILSGVSACYPGGLEDRPDKTAYTLMQSRLKFGRGEPLKSWPGLRSLFPNPVEVGFWMAQLARKPGTYWAS